MSPWSRAAAHRPACQGPAQPAAPHTPAPAPCPQRSHCQALLSATCHGPAARWHPAAPWSPALPLHVAAAWPCWAGGAALVVLLPAAFHGLGDPSILVLSSFWNCGLDWFGGGGWGREGVLSLGLCLVFFGCFFPASVILQKCLGRSPNHNLPVPGGARETKQPQVG